MSAPQRIECVRQQCAPPADVAGVHDALADAGANALPDARSDAIAYNASTDHTRADTERHARARGGAHRDAEHIGEQRRVQRHHTRT